MAPAGALLAAFLVLPVLILGRISFYPADRSFGATGWSLRHYAKFAGDTFYLSVLGETVLYGLVVALATLVVGFPVGYSLARMPARGRRWRIALVILPLTLSLVVNVFGWLVILGGEGMVNRLLVGLGLIDAPLRFLFNRGAVLLVLAHTFLPFQFLSIMSVVAHIDPALEEAAANLRAGRCHDAAPRHPAARLARDRGRVHAGLHPDDLGLRDAATRGRRARAHAGKPHLRADHRRPELAVRRRHVLRPAGDRAGALAADEPLGPPADLGPRAPDGPAFHGESRAGCAVSRVFWCAAASTCCWRCRPIIVIASSVSRTRFLTFPPQGFTLGWYERAFQSQAFMGSLALSTQLAVGATILALAIGTPAAYAIERRRFPRARRLPRLRDVAA